MKTRLLLLLFIVAMAAALLRDIRQWRMIHDGAAAACERGVAQFRKGHYSAALDDFRAASASGERSLRQRALYNLGTTHLRMAALAGSSHGSASAVHLSAAARHLGESLALDATDADASHNLSVARGRLAALKGTAAEESDTAASRRQASREDESSEAANAKDPAELSRSAARSGTATDIDREGARRRADTLTRDQALRMLDESRGREALPSAVAADRRNGASAPPEKDW